MMKTCITDASRSQTYPVRNIPCTLLYDCLLFVSFVALGAGFVQGCLLAMYAMHTNTIQMHNKALRTVQKVCRLKARTIRDATNNLHKSAADRARC